MKIEFGVRMGKHLSMEEIAYHARLAEELGFSHMNCGDAPFLNRDPYVILTIMAQNTSRMRIGQAVTDSTTHHPSVIANSTATIDELSCGRMYLGLGAGGPFGKVMKPQTPDRVRETIEFIRRYMAGEEAEWDGAKMRSYWVRKPVPIYLAAEGPKMLQLAGELADGVITIGFHPELVKWKLEQVEKGAMKAGRDPSHVDYWARGMVYVTDSINEARHEVGPYTAGTGLARILRSKTPEAEGLYRRLNKVEDGLAEALIADAEKVEAIWDPYWFERVGAPFAEVVSDRLMNFYHLIGRPDYICERIEKLGQLGARTISVWMGTVIDQVGQKRKIATLIMPHFRI